MEVVKRTIADLIKDPANAREHSEYQIEKIMYALQEYGQRKPIVVNAANVVLAGNATLRAARNLGWTEIYVAISDLDPAKERAYAIADNRTAELATWDDATLEAQLLEIMKDDPQALDGLGFEDFQFEGAEEQEEVRGAKVPASLQIVPGREYVVILCSAGEAGAGEYDRLKDLFGLGLVRRAGYKDGSEYEAVGQQRILEASKCLSRVRVNPALEESPATE